MKVVQKVDLVLMLVDVLADVMVVMRVDGWVVSMAASLAAARVD